MLVKCLYCDVDNDAMSTGGFCDSCGKKLPASAMVRPRRAIIGGPDADGGPEPLPRHRAVVFEALVAAAIVHLVAGGVFFMLGALLFNEKIAHFGALVLSWTILPTAVVAVLAVLARYQPEPSVLIALVLWVGWVGASFLLHTQLALGWSVVHLALLLMLVRAAWLARRTQRDRGI